MPLRKPHFLASLVIALLAGLIVIPTAGTQAHDGIVLSVVLPDFMRDFLAEDIFTQFETDNPGVKVNIVYGNMAGGSASQDLDAYLQAVQDYVSTADVVGIQTPDISVEATRAGYFRDLSPLTSADSSLNSDDFIPSVWQSVQWDGGVWALPVSTDVIMLIYDPAAFDKAGLAYPNAAWTIDDFANAARKLAQYDASGAVTTPGLVTFNNTQYLLRALLGQGVYDSSASPDAPSFANPALETLLTTWAGLETDGVVATVINGDINSAPLRIFGGMGLGFPRGDNATPPAASLLPGGVAGLAVQGFAVSSGSLYPEQAYKLAKYLTNNAQIANNPFGIAPARNSLKGVQPQPGRNEGGGGPILSGRNFSPENQAVIDQGIANGIPASELRYIDYVVDALNSMQSSGLDAHSALQQAEATAVANLQTAASKRDTITITVATPVPEVVLQPGEVALNFGFESFIRPIPNEQEWNKLIQDFTANDPQVKKINMDTPFGNASNSSDKYDCYYLPYNAVPSLDESKVLSLDPYLDADASFDRNDVVGNVMSLLQKDNQTWALPVTIQPQVLEYNTTLFAKARVPAPQNGWTIDQFNDALRALKPNPDDPKPFVPRDPGGNYLLQLIAAYGGLPIDMRTNPPTLNFTDPTNVAAIQQVLDLAKNGYIDYQQLARMEFQISLNGEVQDPIYTEMLNGFIFRQGRRGGNADGTGTTTNNTGSSEYQTTTYPTGTKYSAISYDIGTAYISATTQNADACYRWISTVARHPELFSAMPARRSFINDPSFAASAGADTIAAYNQIDKLMSAPNTINFQSPFAGATNPGNFIVQFWLNRAFDNYVLNNADLQTELSSAQSDATAYQQCAANIPPFDASTQTRQTYFEQFTKCAGLADPTVANLFAGPGG